jgi:hypothetical protein
MGADSAIHGDRTQVWISLDELGQIDSEGRFTTMVTPSLLAPSGELRSKPWGQEQHGPASFQAVYEFALTNTHWEFTPNHGELREVRGAPEWRIEGALVIPTVTVQTAIRYLTRLHDESSSSVIKRNAKKSIAEIQRLVNREKSNAKP